MNGVHPEEVHIVKVTSDSVRLESGPIQSTFLHTVEHSLSRVLSSSSKDIGESHFGPPPPSPPASFERVEEEDASPPPPPSKQVSKSDPISRPVTFDEPIRDGKLLMGSTRNSSRGVSSRSGFQSHELLQRSSTDTKAIVNSRMSASTQRTPRVSNQPDHSASLAERPLTAEVSESQLSRIAYQSPDGHLQPPPTGRPARRNTTGSAPRPTRAPINQQGYSSQPFVFEDGDVEDELASDIQMQADQIRRERNSKRVKAQQEAEAALTRSASMSRGARGDGRDDGQVLVGNLIGEDHVNYVLMYNMLTGIRIAVSAGSGPCTRSYID